MTKLFVSEQAATSQNCGQDAGFDQEIDPETCRVIPTPAPLNQKGRPTLVLAVFNEEDFYIEASPRGRPMPR